MMNNGKNKSSMELENKIKCILMDFEINEITIEEATNQILLLMDVAGKYSWLDPDDLEFAKALQEENRLEAVKWLCENARLHSLTPLKDAKDILDAYH